MRVTARSITLVAAALLSACATSSFSPPEEPRGDVTDVAVLPERPPQPVYGRNVPASDDAQVATVTLAVRGMTCPIKCVRAIRNYLAVVKGVRNVVVDYPTKRVYVHVDPGTDPQTLVDAMRAPYSATVL